MQKILFLTTGKAATLNPIEQQLSKYGYRVYATDLNLDTGNKKTNGIEILCNAFSGRPPDILIADLSDAADLLPVRHAIRLLKCAWGDDLPLPSILLLMEERHFQCHGWETYADDFLLPPYGKDEIMLRIRLLLFRKRHVEGADTLTISDVKMNLESGRVYDSSGQDIALTPKESDLLRFLAIHRGKYFARDRLLDMVWGVDYDGGERTVDIHIRRLRAKLPKSAAALLDTRRGAGYGIMS